MHLPDPDSIHRRSRLLIVNPNSTTSMTQALVPLVEGLGYHDIEFSFVTGPESSPPSINNGDDCHASAAACLQMLTEMLTSEASVSSSSKHKHPYDAVLIACYSEHPLVHQLKSITPVPITGIFESSVTNCLAMLHKDKKFGIVSTGKVWEELLSTAVENLLGGKGKRFGGVETTGLNATELHDAPPEVLKKKMKDAVKRLVAAKDGHTDIGAICLGCAGMVGMEEMVREALVEELGEKVGGEIRIVDGVVGGVGVLVGLVRAGF